MFLANALNWGLAFSHKCSVSLLVVLIVVTVCQPLLFVSFPHLDAARFLVNQLDLSLPFAQSIRDIYYREEETYVKNEDVLVFVEPVVVLSYVLLEVKYTYGIFDTASGKRERRSTQTSHRQQLPFWASLVALKPGSLPMVDATLDAAVGQVLGVFEPMAKIIAFTRVLRGLNAFVVVLCAVGLGCRIRKVGLKSTAVLSGVVAVIAALLIAKIAVVCAVNSSVHVVMFPVVITNLSLATFLLVVFVVSWMVQVVQTRRAINKQRRESLLTPFSPYGGNIKVPGRPMSPVLDSYVPVAETQNSFSGGTLPFSPFSQSPYSKSLYANS